MRRAEALLKNEPAPEAGPLKGGDQANQAAQHAFKPPPVEQHGWGHVVPERFSSVCPRDCTEQDEEAPNRRHGRKRARLTEEAKPSADGSARSGPSKGEAPAPASSSEVKPDEQLSLAAELADRTAVLTYAYTAAFALQGFRSGQESGAPERRLGVVVLGAAGDAELEDLKSWKVLGDALLRDVCISFVGPEVPDQLVGTRQQHGRVALHFLQGKFDESPLGADGDGPEEEIREGALAAEAAGPPDVYLAFNPGFTCPDYEWGETIQALSRAALQADAGAAGTSAGRSSPGERPCLVVATNTRSEAEMDADMLQGEGWLAAQPAAQNPYRSLKVLQNGVLANDLYCKNSWLSMYCYVGEPDGGRKGRRRRGGRKGK